MPVEHGQLHSVPKPHEVQVSLADLEAAQTLKEAEGEQSSEATFEKNFEKATEEANPGNETLNAMEK